MSERQILIGGPPPRIVREAFLKGMNGFGPLLALIITDAGFKSRPGGGIRRRLFRRLAAIGLAKRFHFLSQDLGFLFGALSHRFQLLLSVLERLGNSFGV